MILKSEFNIFIADYITVLKVRAKIFHFDDGRFKRVLLAVHRTLDADMIPPKNCPKWTVSDVRSTCSIARGNSPEEAIEAARQRLEDRTDITYLKYLEYSKERTEHWKKHHKALIDELPFVEPIRQLEMLRESGTIVTIPWSRDKKRKASGR